MGTCGDVHSWEAARACVRTLGEVPPVARRSIRALFEGKALSSDKFLTGVLEQPTFRLSLLDTLQCLNVTPSPDAPILEVAKSLSSKDLLGIVLCEFVASRLRVSSPACWKIGESDFIARRRVGAKLGMAAGRIGTFAGLLLAPLRILSYLLMCRDEPNRYREYLSYLKERGTWIDEEFEYRTWKCAYYQVASQIITHYGLPADLANGINTALSSSLGTPLSENLNRFRIAEVWTECLAIGGDLPEVHGEEEFLMEESKMDLLLKEVETLRAGNASSQGAL